MDPSKVLHGVNNLILDSRPPPDRARDDAGIRRVTTSGCKETKQE